MDKSQDYRNAYAAGFKAAMALVPHRWCSGEKIREHMHEALSAVDGCPGFEVEPGVFSGCDQSGGDCPICGK